MELSPQKDSNALELTTQKQASTSVDMKQGESFMQVVEWNKGPHLREFQKIKTATQDYFL